MKKNVTALLLFLLVLIMLTSCRENVMTSEVLVAKCTEALGSYSVINNIETLRIKAVYPDHGDVPREFEMIRPNKSQNPLAGLVFDGERACFLNGMDGVSQPEIVDPEEWKDYEVEIGYHFPAFLDHPAVYQGIKEIDDKYYYKLGVNLPLGAKMFYLIDRETFLTAKVEFEFMMHGELFRNWRDFSDYKDVDGFKYPHKFTYGSRTGRQKGWIHSVEINAEIDDENFKIPQDV